MGERQNTRHVLHPMDAQRWHTRRKCGSTNATLLASADPGCKRVTSGGWEKKVYTQLQAKILPFKPSRLHMPVLNRTTSFEETPQHALPRILPKTQPLFSLVPFFVAREPTRAKTPTSKVVTGECSGQDRAKSHP